VLKVCIFLAKCSPLPDLCPLLPDIQAAVWRMGSC
jgi:hypothetical protein